MSGPGQSGEAGAIRGWTAAGGFRHVPGVPRVSVHGLCCELSAAGGRRVAVLHEVGLEVMDREFVVVLGPSGAGKTTLLRVVAGLERPTRGTVKFDGQEVTGWRPEERDVALVFQGGALFPHLTAEQNLMLGLTLRGVGPEEARRRATAMAARLGVEAVLSRRPEWMSGGERQRVALGRALVRRPAVMLLDEPFAGVDTPLRRQLLRDLRELHREAGSTTLYVTHDQQEALSLGSRVAVMADGRVVEVGVPEQLCSRPETLFAASFLGDPPMNLVRGRLVGVGGEPCFLAEGIVGSMLGPLPHVGFPGTAQEPEAVLGIPASALRLEGEGCWRGVVETAETVGWDRLVYVRSGRVQLWFRIEGHEPPSPGCEVQIRVDPGRVIVFDPSTGRRFGESQDQAAIRRAEDPAL